MNKWKKDFFDKILSTDQNIIKEAINIVEKHLPVNIYKYRSINENSIIDFIDDTLWCSTLDKFNDPYEGYITFDADEVYYQVLSNKGKLQINIDNKNELMKFINTPQNNLYLSDYNNYKKIIKHKLKTFISKTQKEVKICSFSESWDNRLMWAHYAKNHTGFCLEYNIKLKNKIIFEYGTHLYPIIYRDKLLDITEDFVNSLLKNPYSSMLPHIMAIVKDKIWEYENEWRILTTKTSNNEISLKPTSIYLGSQMDDLLKKKLRNIADKKKLDIYEVVMDTSEYKLKKQRIQ